MIALQHIASVVFRHIKTMWRVSWLVEITYWTVLDIIIFGSLGKATALMAPNSANIAVSQALITNAVLWYIVLRGAITMGFTLLNELFDANLTALFSTPLTIIEWIIGGIIVGSMAAIINVTLGSLMAFIMFDCTIFALGLPVIASAFSLLVSGWVIGLILMGILLFVGKKGTGLAFVICWSLMPFSCVYYPLEVLPQFLQTFVLGIPMAHIFISTRNNIMHGISPWTHIGISFLLNAMYLVIAIILFSMMFKHSKKSGLARLELEW